MRLKHLSPIIKPDIVLGMENSDTPNNPKSGEQEQSGEDMRHILRTFEQILEIMPNDRSTLQAAEQAAQQCGDVEKALTYRLRLADQLAAEGDEEALAALVEALRVDRDPRARSWVASYDMRTRAAQQATADKAPSASPHKAAAVNISEEIDLAWKLFENGELSQEDYATLVSDLTESSTDNSNETVSVLHVLEATNHQKLDKILAYLAENTRLPYISLACFTPRAELIPILSPDFCRSRGALVFEMLCNEPLVALLNPVSESLRKDVEEQTGRRCHFFLTRASEFENALTQMLQAAE